MTTIDELVEQLTTEEKVALLAGEDMWHLPAIERVGIGRLKMSDGPIGVRGEFYGGGPSSLCFPCGAALGATFDVELVERVGVALGEEAHAKSAHVLLGPTINIQRFPLGGRHFECYSEDPMLTGQLASAYVRGVQSTGVAACVKHFAANDTEVERFTIDAIVDERTLREVYIAPFEAALLGAGAWSVMGAYNKLNGHHCCDHPWLLGELLRDEWGWDGAVVSDWFATHETASGVNNGLDVEMPGPAARRGAKLLEAITAGEVKPDAIDTLVRRVLLLADRTGALHNTAPLTETYEDDPARRQLARDAAAAAVVILRNEDRVLPLVPAQLERVAVIGPNADVVFQPLGGGSAEVSPPYVVTPLEGLRLAMPDVEVVHEVGCLPSASFISIDGRHLLGGRFDVTLVRDSIEQQSNARSSFRWPSDVKTATATATYVAPATGRFAFELRGRGRMRLSVDGAVICDGWERGETPPVGTVALTAGGEYSLLLEFEAPADPLWFTGVELGVQLPWPDDPLAAAALAARDADVAVVVIGLTRHEDTEGRDRPHMDLSEKQNELVAAVAAANPRTVVVLNTGSPVTMPWLDAVSAVVQLWYPGQEGGHALADVLTGAADGGRLPCTFPVRVEDSPAFAGYPGNDGKLAYEEGVFVGYRGFEAANTAPLFPFGHGLTYATFAYGDIEADRSGASVTVTNTSDRAATEVVQLYVGDVASRVPRPAKELKGFARLRLAPGESGTARFEFDDRTFAFWDNGWQVEPGDFDIAAGASSADIRTRTTITI